MSLDLLSPRESQYAARKEAVYWREQSKKWIEKPSRFFVVADSLEVHARQRPSPIGLQWTVTARTNWFARHRKLLTKRLAPLNCRILTKDNRPGSKMASDLKRNRIGGYAVLPVGVSWPTITWQTYGVGLSHTALGSYVGTFDLRRAFKLKQFPDAVSFFVCCYDECDRQYSAMANPYCPVGVVVPLQRKQQLHSVKPPQIELEIESQPLTAWKMSDFPAESVSNDQACARAQRAVKRPSIEVRTYAEIEAIEPGTGGWAHLRGNKIGGYPHFIQNDLTIALRQADRRIRWQLIATYSGDAIHLGDAGTVYILAGWDAKANEWRWHCEWQCH